jgi:hypothetical protein
MRNFRVHNAPLSGIKGLFTPLWAVDISDNSGLAEDVNGSADSSFARKAAASFWGAGHPAAGSGGRA